MRGSQLDGVSWHPSECIAKIVDLSGSLVHAQHLQTIWMLVAVVCALMNLG